MYLCWHLYVFSNNIRSDVETVYKVSFGHWDFRLNVNWPITGLETDFGLIPYKEAVENKTSMNTRDKVRNCSVKQYKVLQSGLWARFQSILG